MGERNNREPRALNCAVMRLQRKQRWCRKYELAVIWIRQ
jgi:hypothetical protein